MSRGRCDVREEWLQKCNTADCEEGDGVTVKESKKPLEAREGKEMSSPWSPKKGRLPSQYLDFSPMTPMLGF